MEGLQKLNEWCIPINMCVVKTFFLLMIFSFGASAQQQAGVWVFPNGNLLDFSLTPPEVSSGTQILPSDVEVEGVASMSDENGNLLFYSDGVKLWDWQHNVVSSSLMGHQSSTNSVLIVPVPATSDEYYLFTLDAMQNNLDNGLVFNRIKACRDNGVSIVLANQFLSSNMTEKMTAIRHQNGQDYWLVTHEFATDVFKVYLVNEQGVSLDGMYSCGAIHGPELSAAVGQMKASPDGNFIVANLSNKQRTDIVSFDKVQGSVSCLLSFPPDTSSSGNFRSIYGVSFSQNSRYLYISGGARFRLWQFDMNELATSTDAFYNSKYTLSDDQFQSNTSFHQLQLGPDGKIYCASWNNEHLAVIHEPDLGGLACAFEDSAIVLENQGNYGLPAFIDSYDYTISGICDTGVGVEDAKEQTDLNFYPNPTANQLNINLSPNQNAMAVGMLDMLGREVLRQPFTTQLDVSHLPAGNYVLTVYTGDGVLRERVSVLKK